MTISNWTAEQIAARPIETRLAKKIYKTLKAAENPILTVHDGEEEYRVGDLDEFLEAVFSVDILAAFTHSGQFITLIMGQDWEMIADYNVSLEEALKPVNDLVDRNMD